MIPNLLSLFLYLIEANIGSEDSSLSDALVLDDGESLFFTLLYSSNNSHVLL